MSSFFVTSFYRQTEQLLRALAWVAATSTTSAVLLLASLRGGDRCSIEAAPRNAA